jgi:hypothetical protein
MVYGLNWRVCNSLDIKNMVYYYMYMYIHSLKLGILLFGSVGNLNHLISDMYMNTYMYIYSLWTKLES